MHHLRLPLAPSSNASTQLNPSREFQRAVVLTRFVHYCYARATHAYRGLNAEEDFSAKILVNTNLPEVLRDELARPTWTGERIAIGTATDPYQPCKGHYRLTRRALEVLRVRLNSLNIVTKSTLILRDPDLLRRYQRAYAGANAPRDYLAALQ